MPDVIHTTTLQFKRSVDGGPHPEPAWKWSPDMSQVAGLDRRYWKWDGAAERPIPMTAGEQQTVNDAIVASLKDAAEGLVDDDEGRRTDKLLRALTLVVMDEVNILRAQHGLGARTVAQLKAALRNQMT